ncbi:CLUMA_CG012097, isoform A [Clunio marinus]|uniref:Succinate dehydrogenase assembly factor 3 n=1 Tax=Clunio marinus TaxID=568069 RepID=A0A1J1IH16_9DIPT|nr:CLUMA_CG012097, isoform A [Clunio marinus]
MCISSHVRRVKTLYKSILRLHRGLPQELSELGNNYAKDEFKRHKNLTTDSPEVTVFMFEWTEYAINLANQLGVKSVQQERRIGKDLDLQALDTFRDEQVQQLHELYKTAKGVEEETKQ